MNAHVLQVSMRTPTEVEILISNIHAITKLFI